MRFKYNVTINCFIDILLNDNVFILHIMINMPLHIYNTQSVSPSSLTTAHFVGVLNVQRCKTHFYTL